MVVATALKAGMALRLEGEVYKVVAVEARSGSGQMAGAVHVRLRSLSTGSVTDRRFRPEEKLTDLTLEKQTLEFLYQDKDDFVFMHPETFEQVTLGREFLGSAAAFLRPEMRLPVEMLQGRPAGIVFPETVELRVTATGQPMRAQQTSATKAATLENGMEVQVPLFIKEGEVIRIEVETGKYLERMKEAKEKRG